MSVDQAQTTEGMAKWPIRQGPGVVNENRNVPI